MDNIIKVSSSQEDYLETILFLQQKNKTVRITDIAIEMNISKSSVNRAINNLKLQGLVEHKHYGGLNLTKNGEIIAKTVERRHNVLKRFLYEFLNVEEKLAEKEACMIEHSISLDTIEKLDNYLNKSINQED